MNITSILSELNSYQRDAVEDESRALLLNAHVGSGKTKVLISKVLHLAYEKNVPLNKMVVLTFTNKAAKEIKDRLISVLPVLKNEDMPYFGTFHSVAAKMLSNVLPINELGYEKDFSIVDMDEISETADRLIDEHRLNIKYQSGFLSRVQKIRNNGESLAGKYLDDTERLWNLIVEEKMEQNKMDFDDLLINAIKLLKLHPQSFEWVIVDEFQDSNYQQLDFITSLTTSNTKIFAVGDKNQIIYTWRGSQKDLFDRFKSKYDAKEMSLPINYRSTANILNVAKTFLEGDNNLEGKRDIGNKVNVNYHYNPFLEAAYLAEKIKKLNKEGVGYNEIAIFYRMQSQSGALQAKLLEEKIPFETSLKKTLKDIPVLYWLVGLLKASINIYDKNSIYRVLKDDRFGEGLSAVSIKEVFQSLATYDNELLKKIKGFKTWVSENEIADAMSIYEYFDLSKRLLPNSVDYDENTRLVQEFLSDINLYIDSYRTNLWNGLVDYLNSSALYGMPDIKDHIYEEDSVKLMTLHACKGLEFKCVFIIGLNEGLVPFKLNPVEDYNEEKRLFYVGITRAKDELELSYYTDSEIINQMINMRKVRNEQSEFLKSLPEQLFRDNPNENIECNSDAQVMNKRVLHEKFGEGTITDENGDVLTIMFDLYGEQTIHKMFAKLTYL